MATMSGGVKPARVASACDPRVWLCYDSVMYPCDAEYLKQLKDLKAMKAAAAAGASKTEEGRDAAGRASPTRQVSMEKSFWRSTISSRLASNGCVTKLHLHQEVAIARLFTLVMDQCFVSWFRHTTSPTPTSWEEFKPRSFGDRIAKHESHMDTLQHHVKKDVSDVGAHRAAPVPLDLHAGVLVADAPGLGKTLEVICTMVMVRKVVTEMMALTGRCRDAVDFLCMPFLVVCPNSLMAHWVNEFVRHISLPAENIHIYHASTADVRDRKLAAFLRTRRNAMRHACGFTENVEVAVDMGDANSAKWKEQRKQLKEAAAAKTLTVVITTASTLRSESKVRTRSGVTKESKSLKRDDNDETYMRLADEARAKRAELALFNTPMLISVFDEAHQTLGNVQTASHAAAATISRMVSMCVTATPIVNRMSEDLSAMSVLMHDFERAFETTWGHGRYNRKFLDEWRATRVLCRGKEHLHLPRVTERTVDVLFTESEGALYRQILDDTIDIAERADTAAKEEKRALFTMLLEKLMRLRQVPLHPILIHGRAITMPLSTESHKAKRARLGPIARASATGAAAHSTAAAALEKTLRAVRTADVDGGEEDMADNRAILVDDDDDDDSDDDDDDVRVNTRIGARQNIKTLYKSDCAKVTAAVEGKTPLTPSSKVSAILALVDTMVSEGNDKMMIASFFSGFLDVLEYFLRLRGIGYTRLDGDTPTMARQPVLDAFAATADTRILLTTIKAGGVGLNIACANRVVVCEPYWTRAAVEQAINRVHRIGQTKPVTITLLRTVGSIEFPIFDMMGVKNNVHRYVLENNVAAPKTFRYEGMTLKNIREILYSARRAAVNHTHIYKTKAASKTAPPPARVPAPAPALSVEKIQMPQFHSKHAPALVTPVPVRGSLVDICSNLTTPSLSSSKASSAVSLSSSSSPSPSPSPSSSSSPPPSHPPPPLKRDARALQDSVNEIERAREADAKRLKRSPSPSPSPSPSVLA